MLTPSTRLRLQAILDRIGADQPVTLQERIYVQKFADRDQGVAAWLLQARRRQLQQTPVDGKPKDGIDHLLEQMNLLKDENSHLKKECFSGKTELMKATEVIGAFKDLPPIYKVTDKDSIFQMVAAVLLHVMNIIMRKTQQVTRLRTLTQVIFQREL
ncbi:MAG: hypothetical protein ACOVQK_09400, partial [Cyanobium sp.]